MSKTGIKVFGRARPPAVGAQLTEYPIEVSEKSVKVAHKGNNKTFQLDECFSSESRQEQVYESVKPVVMQALKGISTVVMAYGATGSGKTWTMQGDTSSPGIIPRVVKDLFHNQQTSSEAVVKVFFSYVEILNEEVYDLLNDHNRDIKICKGAQGETNLWGVALRDITTYDEFCEAYLPAARRRTTGSTNLNRSSSRSHSILTVHVETVQKPNPTATLLGKICLVDLAGSEDNKRTGNEGKRMRESGAINNSLSTLSMVVEAISKKATDPSVHIPYRSCKLTHLLQDALGGSSTALLLCCFSTDPDNASDTLRTLMFSQMTRRIKKEAPKVNKRVNPIGTKIPCRPQSSLPARKSTPAGQESGVKGTSKSLLVKNITGCGAAHPVQGTGIEAVNNSGRGGTRRILGDVSQRENQACATVSAPLDGDIYLKKSVVAVIEKTSALPSSDEQLRNAPKSKDPEIPSGQMGKPHPQTGLEIDRLSTLDIQNPINIPGMTYDERKKVAGAFVDQGRKYQILNDLSNALEHYSMALKYMPEKVQIAIRIHEIRMAMEGKMPVPELSKGSKEYLDGLMAASSSSGRNKRDRVAATDNLDVQEDAEPLLKKSKGSTIAP